MIVHEVAPAAEQALFSRLDACAAQSPMDQWASLESLRYNALRNPELTPALVDYAARPGGLLLLRAYALDIGVEGACTAVNRSQATPAQTAMYDHMRRVVPEYFDLTAPTLNHVPLATEQLGPAYFWFFREIARSEGINPWIIEPKGHDLGYDPTTVPTNVPVAASVLLRKLIGGRHPLDLNNLSPQVARDALELALDFRSEAFERAVLEDSYNSTVEFARLWRLTAAAGFEHDAPIDTLYMVRNSEVIACVEALNRLHDTVPLLSELYPTQNPGDLEHGVRSMIANGLFALQYYVENNNRIDAEFSFPDGAPIPINEESPLALIESSIRAIELAAAAVTNADVIPEFGPGNTDFHHCRFRNRKTGEPPRVSYHGRPNRGESFDPTFEFAGDATSRYRVQLFSQRPIRFANAAQTVDTVCFRLDYDARGFALDFGALRENPYTQHPNDLEVRIGRFFAFGNYLRSQRVGVPPTMNHVRSLQNVCATEADFSNLVTGQWQRLLAKAEMARLASR